MTDLVEFIEARLQEDQAAADACAAVGDFHWVEADEGDPDGRIEDGQGRVVIWDHEANLSGRIARHDPARVLREVEAKRRILARHQRVDQVTGWAHTTPKPGEDVSFRQAEVYCSACRSGDCHEYDNSCAYIDWPCPEVRDLAASYANHPDYRQQWSP